MRNSTGNECDRLRVSLHYIYNICSRVLYFLGRLSVSSKTCNSQGKNKLFAADFVAGDIVVEDILVDIKVIRDFSLDFFGDFVLGLIFGQRLDLYFCFQGFSSR